MPFLSHKAQDPKISTDMCFLSPLPDTSLACETMDMGLVHRVVCLFMSQLSLVLIVPTHRGMARLS